MCLLSFGTDMNILWKKRCDSKLGNGLIERVMFINEKSATPDPARLLKFSR